MNLVSLTLIAAGSVLIYSSVKGYNPVDVVKSTLSGKAPAATVTKAYDISPTTDAYPVTPGV